MPPQKPEERPKGNERPRETEERDVDLIDLKKRTENLIRQCGWKIDPHDKGRYPLIFSDTDPKDAKDRKVAGPMSRNTAETTLLPAEKVGVEIQDLENRLKDSPLSMAEAARYQQLLMLQAAERVRLNAKPTDREDADLRSDISARRVYGDFDEAMTWDFLTTLRKYCAHFERRQNELGPLRTKEMKDWERQAAQTFDRLEAAIGKWEKTMDAATTRLLAQQDPGNAALQERATKSMQQCIEHMKGKDKDAKEFTYFGRKIKLDGPLSDDDLFFLVIASATEMRRETGKSVDFRIDNLEDDKRIQELLRASTFKERMEKLLARLLTRGIDLRRPANAPPQNARLAHVLHRKGLSLDIRRLTAEAMPRKNPDGTTYIPTVEQLDDINHQLQDLDRDLRESLSTLVITQMGLTNEMASAGFFDLRIDAPPPEVGGGLKPLTPEERKHYDKTKLPNEHREGLLIDQPRQNIDALRSYLSLVKDQCSSMIRDVDEMDAAIDDANNNSIIQGLELRNRLIAEAAEFAWWLPNKLRHLGIDPKDLGGPEDLTALGEQVRNMEERYAKSKTVLKTLRDDLQKKAAAADARLVILDRRLGLRDEERTRGITELLRDISKIGVELKAPLPAAKADPKNDVERLKDVRAQMDALQGTAKKDSNVMAALERRYEELARTDRKIQTERERSAELKEVLTNVGKLAKQFDIIIPIGPAALPENPSDEQLLAEIRRQVDILQRDTKARSQPALMAAVEKFVAQLSEPSLQRIALDARNDVVTTTEVLLDANEQLTLIHGLATSRDAYFTTRDKVHWWHVPLGLFWSDAMLGSRGLSAMFSTMQQMGRGLRYVPDPISKMIGIAMDYTGRVGRRAKWVNPSYLGQRGVALPAQYGFRNTSLGRFLWGSRTATDAAEALPPATRISRSIDWNRVIRGSQVTEVQMCQAIDTLIAEGRLDAPTLAAIRDSRRAQRIFASAVATGDNAELLRAASAARAARNMRIGMNAIGVAADAFAIYMAYCDYVENGRKIAATKNEELKSIYRDHQILNLAEMGLAGTGIVICGIAFIHAVIAGEGILMAFSTTAGSVMLPIAVATLGIRTITINILRVNEEWAQDVDDILKNYRGSDIIAHLNKYEPGKPMYWQGYAAAGKEKITASSFFRNSNIGTALRSVGGGVQQQQEADYKANEARNARTRERLLRAYLIQSLNVPRLPGELSGEYATRCKKILEDQYEYASKFMVEAPKAQDLTNARHHSELMEYSRQLKAMGKSDFLEWTFTDFENGKKVEKKFSFDLAKYDELGFEPKPGQPHYRGEIIEKYKKLVVGGKISLEINGSRTAFQNAKEEDRSDLLYAGLREIQETLLFLLKDDLQLLDGFIQHIAESEHGNLDSALMNPANNMRALVYDTLRPRLQQAAEALLQAKSSVESASLENAVSNLRSVLIQCKNDIRDAEKRKPYLTAVPNDKGPDATQVLQPDFISRRLLLPARPLERKMVLDYVRNEGTKLLKEKGSVDIPATATIDGETFPIPGAKPWLHLPLSGAYFHFCNHGNCWKIAKEPHRPGIPLGHDAWMDIRSADAAKFIDRHKETIASLQALNVVADDPLSQAPTGDRQVAILRRSVREFMEKVGRSEDIPIDFTDIIKDDGTHTVQYKGNKVWMNLPPCYIDTFYGKPDEPHVKGNHGGGRFVWGTGQGWIKMWSSEEDAKSGRPPKTTIYLKPKE
jgi:hypothetical protein